MKKYPKYKSGNYHPINKQKYRGKYPLHYRSSWERKMCYWLDKNPKIREWGIESTIIPYKDPTRKNTIHRYIIDFTALIETKNGIRRYYIEVKPYKEVCKPVRGKKKESTFVCECLTYARNSAKWTTASNWAKKKGSKFIILTENELMI